MGISRSTFSQDVTIYCVVLVSLHHALTHGTSRLFVVLSDMSNSVPLEMSLFLDCHAVFHHPVAQR